MQGSGRLRVTVEPDGATLSVWVADKGGNPGADMHVYLLPADARFEGATGGAGGAGPDRGPEGWARGRSTTKSGPQPDRAVGTLRRFEGENGGWATRRRV